MAHGHSDSVPVDDDDNVTLSTVIKALADDIEVGSTSKHHPTDGRVLEDGTDGTVYIGNGSAWIDTSALPAGLDVPDFRSDTMQSNTAVNYSDLREAV